MGSQMVYAGCSRGGCTKVDKYHLTGNQALKMEQTTVHTFFGEGVGEFLAETEVGIIIDAATASVASPAMAAHKYTQTQTGLSFYDMLHDIGQQDQNAGRLHQPLTIVTVRNTSFLVGDEFVSTQRTVVYIEYGSNQVTPPLIADNWSGLYQNINEAAQSAWIAEH